MSAWRTRLRSLAPLPVRRAVALARRAVRDRASGLVDDIVVAGVPPSADWPVQIALEQKIFETPTSAGKVVNLRRAAALISATAIPPGKVFSFWALVGAPTAARGFVLGRAIVADEVSTDIGGGLCQISGLIYELALRAGLAVVERHPHSRDLYTDATRFALPGLDATVGHGFKDLRFRNTQAAPLGFAFDITPTCIAGRLVAPTSLVPCDIAISVGETAVSRHVRVTRTDARGRSETISENLYVIENSARQ